MARRQRLGDDPRHLALQLDRRLDVLVTRAVSKSVPQRDRTSFSRPLFIEATRPFSTPFCCASARSASQP